MKKEIKLTREERYWEEYYEREMDFDGRITPENTPIIEWILNICQELFKQSEAIRKLEIELFAFSTLDIDKKAEREKLKEEEAETLKMYNKLKKKKNRK